jgi:hypothetical protein
LLLAGCSGHPTPGSIDDADVGSSGEGGSATTSSDSGSADDGGRCAPSLASIEQDVFVPHCLGSGCHEAQSPAAGLDLQSEELAARLVGVSAAICDGVLVIPADPDGSLLYQKITDGQTCGVAMPPDVPLGELEVACVRGWIDALDQTCEGCGGDVCIDLETDPGHCGACDEVCPPTATCVGGECKCPDGLEVCGTGCVNTQTNPSHCGGCDVVCGDDEVCNAGACSDGCDDLHECDGACVNLDTDAEHCGACGTPCGMAETCNAGRCGCLADPKSYAADIEPIFVAQCTNMGCHRPPAPSENLDLTAGNGHGELVDVASEQCAQRLLVSPGKPGDSYLLDKLLGQSLCFGSQMPKASPLPAADIQAVADWICTGAAP